MAQKPEEKILDTEFEILSVKERIDELRWEYEVSIKEQVPAEKSWFAEMTKAKDKLRRLRSTLLNAKKELL